MKKIKIKLDSGKWLWVTKVDKDVFCSKFSNNAIPATEENLQRCRAIYPNSTFKSEEVK